MNAHDAHGLEASVEVPVTALRFADKFSDAASGWRFGTTEALRLAAADMMAFAFILAAALAAAATAVEA